jgi:hypothetical protein
MGLAMRNPVIVLVAYLLSYPDAGHGVGTLVPYLPIAAGGPLNAYNLRGDTPSANQMAQDQLWPRLLTFLSDAGPTS